MNQSTTSTRYNRDFFHGRLHEEQQKKRAKELLKAIRNGETEAMQRLQAVHPGAEVSSVVLADAQLVIARENGFTSWPKLKAYCDNVRIQKERIAAGQSVQPDTRETVHIRCGSDIRHALDLGGFLGDFLEFSDPFCQGPLTTDDTRLQHIRTDFISDAYGIARKSVQKRQEAAYTALQQVDSCRHPVLWFEHDAYDQCILAYLLRALKTSSQNIECICVDSVPGISEFVGLGQLAPETLLMIWEEQRRAPTDAEIHWSTVLWEAYATGDVPGLWDAIQESRADFPIMSRAFERHIQELPSLHNNCSLTEELTLQILHERGSLTGKQLFQLLTREYEPLPYLGDLMYWHALTPLLFGKDPLLDLSGTIDTTLGEQTISISKSGIAVLQGEKKLKIPVQHSRSFGGIRVFEQSVRYDRDAQKPCCF